jgi:hypothetical protein
MVYYTKGVYYPPKAHSHTNAVLPAKFEEAYCWNNKLSSEVWEVH